MIEIKKVCDGVYRSAYPDYPALLDAEALEIRHVLNLQNRGDVLELANCEARGLRLFDMDLNGLFPPSELELTLAVAILVTKKYQPILVHCWWGRERTGLVIARLRIAMGWTPQSAYDEMIANGCRWPNSWLYKKRLGL